MYFFLRRFRIAISLLIFIALVICFADIYNLTGHALTGLLHWQFVPALLGVASGSLGILLFFLLFTLLFGRVYCSTLCPLGTYQDMVRRLANLFKSKKARRMSYSKPHTILRYTLLVTALAFFAFGSSALLLWLDPYSNFGRMATNLLGMGVTAGGNALSDVIYAIPAQSYKTFTAGAITAAVLIFIVVTTLSALRGRLYCNTICPVGSLLGFISKYSLFQLRMDPEKCNRCTLCCTKCKAECIDVPAQEIDNSRCVQCYDCATTCSKGAISYRINTSKLQVKTSKRQVNTEEKDEKDTRDKRDTIKKGNRRLFITAVAGIAAAGVATKWFKPAGTSKAITPPGSKSLEHLKRHCTSCHACIAACPSRVLRPASSEYGIDGFTMPVLDYNKSFCNYECTVCSNVCPNGAILPLTSEEKAVVQIGKAEFFHDRCIVVRDETDCGACDEHCPANAIEMIPYGDGLLIPKVDTSICIGCGGCEYICPARPNKAIIVMANPVHQTAGIYREEQKEDIKVNDFGF